MRKLLIFMLVLGLASSASAVLQTSDQTYYFQMETSASGVGFGTGDTITIEIFTGDTQAVTDMLETVLNIDSAASASVAVISNPGDWSTAPIPTTTPDGSGGYNVNISGAIAIGGIAVDTSLYTVQFVGGGPGTVTIDAVSGTWSGWPAVVGPVDAFNDGTTPGYEVYGLPYDQIVIPEPMTIALLGLGSLFLLKRRK